MNPIAFQIGPLSVHWYGLLIGLGILLALGLVYQESKRRKLNPDTVLDGCIYMLPFAFLGARLYYVVFNFSWYWENPSEILKVWHGGLAIHGGVLVGLVFLVFYAKKKHLVPLELLDILAPAVVLAQAIGRWGNFVNQEAHGSPVSESFIARFPSFIQRGMLIDGVYYHPTFLYESLWNMGVFLFLMLLTRKSPRPHGKILAAYLGLYSLGRFFIEDLRTDSLMYGPFQVARMVSLIGMVLAVVILCWLYCNPSALASRKNNQDQS